MRIKILFAALALGACERPSGEADPPATAEAAAAADLDYVGRFAASRELCIGGVWDIGETRIVTDGHTACDVDSVARAPGQITLRLACTAGGTKSDETWQLSRNGADGLRVARNNGRETVDVDLLRCG